MPRAVKPSAERPIFPPAYGGFLPVFERLSDAMVELLHGQLLQFERLASSLDWHELAPQGEFEGLGGLTTRGEIVHIVQSELLLRTEAPLEFLRRLAEAETLFLERQHADPGSRPVYRAIVSVGPGLLGHGRLVALAALFFMARIAAARDAEFHWCFLPREQGAVWFDALSVNTIKRFLRAASYREMDGDDVEAAQRLWETLVPDASRAGTLDYHDWTIGAIAPRGGASGSALHFMLNPPVPGERRAMQIGVRRGGAERTRKTILLPDDRICVSALDDPFAPLKPSDLPKLATEPKAGLEGWEPLYFVTPRADRKIVRMADDLLILAGDAIWKSSRQWFIPLPDDVKLAGVVMEDRLLQIAVNAVQAGQDVMRYWAVNLADGHGSIASTMARKVPSAHLFRNQRPWTLPALNWGSSLEVYSSFGKAFLFAEHGWGEAPRFSPLDKEPKLLWSNGVYCIVRDKSEPSEVQALRHTKRRYDRYAIDREAFDADRLFDMVYAPAQRSLAYSVAPGVWTIPPRHPTAEAATLRLEPHETLLAAYGTVQQATARIWSDARYGGKGTVRTMRYDNGVGTLKQAAIKLGPDALSIAKVQLGDDGVWAMTVDEKQAPAELLVYRRKGGAQNCQRFDLQALALEAVRVELSGLRD